MSEVDSFLDKLQPVFIVSRILYNMLNLLNIQTILELLFFGIMLKRVEEHVVSSALKCNQFHFVNELQWIR